MGEFRDGWWSSTDWGCTKRAKEPVLDQEPQSWGQHVDLTDQMGPFILIHTRSAAVKAATTGL